MPKAIADRVNEAVAATGGDQAAATAQLIKWATPDGAKLFADSRIHARYEHSSYPDLPEQLHKTGQTKADQIWEGRQQWTNQGVATGETVDQLDVNAAYLSALNTALPIGRLVHELAGEFDRKRAGIYEITPPKWIHTALPDPIGNRQTPGKLWVTRPTLQLLTDLAAKQLCAAPEIHQQWTSGSSEALLKKMRETLRDARMAAIKTDDAVTLEYVKAIYSKFVSTMGESTYNQDMTRPDWMHTIRAQAFANLWRKASKAAAAGLTVYRATGTDELHVIGDWRQVFAEGRALTEIKLKGTYQTEEKRVTRRR